MNKLKSFLGIILILFTFIILHDAIILGLGNVFSYLRKDNKTDVIEETYKTRIDILEKQLLEYESAQKKLEIFSHENAVLAKLAVRDIYDFYDYLIISTDSPVKKNNAVVNEKGLVGLVTEANKRTAKVTLLTGKVKVSVKIGDVYGILDEYDKSSNLLIIHNINNHKNISIGEKVETSGLQEIDEGLAIGKVLKIDEKGVEKRIYAEPFVDFDNLNYLMVFNK